MKLTHILGHFPSSINKKKHNVWEDGLLSSSGEPYNLLSWFHWKERVSVLMVPSD
jgi:hypothetical protein